MRREFIRLPPKDWPLLDMNTLGVGTWVEVWSCYDGEVILHGQVTHIIEAGAKPDPVALAPLFFAQSVSATLRHVPVPTRPSKYRRLLVEKRPGGGRTFVYPCDEYSVRFLATTIPERHK